MVLNLCNDKARKAFDVSFLAPWKRDVLFTCKKGMMGMKLLTGGMQTMDFGSNPSTPDSVFHQTDSFIKSISFRIRCRICG